MFQEFPKWLYPENGEPVLVQDAEEEAAVMGAPEPDSVPASAPVEPEPAKRGPGRPRKVVN